MRTDLPCGCAADSEIVWCPEGHPSWSKDIRYEAGCRVCALERAIYAIVYDMSGPEWWDYGGEIAHAKMLVPFRRDWDRLGSKYR